MIGKIKKFFETEANVEPGQASPSPHDVRVATCAIMLEMAQIDGEFSEEEEAHIEEILGEKFGLDRGIIDELVAATHEEKEKSVDMWQFTNSINQNYSKDEKREILKMVWTLVYIDGTVDKHEEYLMRKLSNLLRLTHRDMIDAKIAAKEGE